MKNNTTSFFLMILSIISFCYACQKRANIEILPREQEEPSSALEQSLFDCTDYEIFEVWTLGEPFLSIYAYADFYFFGTSEQLLITEDLNGSTYLGQDIHVNKFIEYQSKLIICANEGIFEVDETLSFNRKTGVGCVDIEIQSDEILLFTSNQDTPYHPRQIHSLEVQDNRVKAYTNSHQGGACDILEDLILLEDNQVLARTCDGTIVRFEDQNYMEILDYKKSAATHNQNTYQMFMLPYEGDVILVTKNGDLFYQIVKVSSRDWGTKVALIHETATSSKDRQMEDAVLTDAMILNDKLYLSTSEKDCQGFHVFDLTKEEILEADYDIIQDPLLPSHCIRQIHQSSDDNIYILSDQNEVTVVKCG